LLRESGCAVVNTCGICIGAADIENVQ